MGDVLVDGQPVQEEKHSRFKVFIHDHFVESDDKALLRALKFQAIFIDVTLIGLVVFTTYMVKRVDSLPIPQEYKALYTVAFLAMMLTALAMLRRPLIVVEVKEVEKNDSRCD